MRYPLTEQIPPRRRGAPDWPRRRAVFGALDPAAGQDLLTTTTAARSEACGPCAASPDARQVLAGAGRHWQMARFAPATPAARPYAGQNTLKHDQVDRSNGTPPLEARFHAHFSARLSPALCSARALSLSLFWPGRWARRPPDWRLGGTLPGRAHASSPSAPSAAVSGTQQHVVRETVERRGAARSPVGDVTDHCQHVDYTV